MVAKTRGATVNIGHPAHPSRDVGRMSHGGRPREERNTTMNLTYAPPSPSPSPVVSVTPTVSVSPSPTTGEKLPVTGPADTWGIVAVGLVLVVGGAALVAWMRARAARG